MMTIRKAIPALALAGALVAGAVGAAHAAPHGNGVWQTPGGHMGGNYGHIGGNFGHGHGHGHHFRGPFIEFFGDPYYAYDDGYYGYRYGGGCGYYRAKWHDTGSRYWLRRYEQCIG